MSQGYKSIKQIGNIDEMLSFYSFYDVFGSIAWIEERGNLNIEFYNEQMMEINKFLKHYY